MSENINKVIRSPKVNNKRITKYVQKHFPKNQLKSHKTHSSDKPYMQKTMQFAKDTKTEMEKTQ